MKSTLEREVKLRGGPRLEGVSLPGGCCFMIPSPVLERAMRRWCRLSRRSHWSWCAVQHTSSREAKALDLKLDELIRISPARNKLIGAEDESHSQLTTRAERLREDHR